MSKPEQLQKLEDQIKGKRVMMMGSHPWNGQHGTMSHIKLFPAIGKYGFVVALDNGVQCTAFDGNQVYYLPETTPKKRRRTT